MQDDPLTPLELAFRKAVQTCLQTRDEAQRRKTPFARWSAAVRAAWFEKQRAIQSIATETTALQKRSKMSAGRAKRTGK